MDGMGGIPCTRCGARGFEFGGRGKFGGGDGVTGELSLLLDELLTLRSGGWDRGVALGSYSTCKQQHLVWDLTGEGMPCRSFFGNW